MRSGAHFIGSDWFSVHHSDYKSGRQIDDNYTRTEIEEGTLSGIGKVHFSDRDHLLELFENFEIKRLEEKQCVVHVPASNSVMASWNIHAIKR